MYAVAMRRSTLTLPEFVGCVAIFSFVAETAMAVRYVFIGSVFGVVVASINAVLALGLAVFLLRHRLHRSPKVR
jgi:small basic protein